MMSHGLFIGVFTYNVGVRLEFKACYIIVVNDLKSKRVEARGY